MTSSLSLTTRLHTLLKVDTHVATTCTKCGGTGLVPLGPGTVYYDEADVWPQEQDVAHTGMVACDCGAGPNYEGHSSSGINDHQLVLVQANGWAAWVDEGIADDVRLLWENNIPTSFSCQGDAHAWRYIALTDDDPATVLRAQFLLAETWVETIEKSTFYGKKPHA